MRHSDRADGYLAYALLSLHSLAENCTNPDFYQLLLETVIPLVPEAEAGSLMVFDKKMDKLLVEATVGYQEISHRKIHLQPGKAVAGKAYETREVQVVNGQDKVKEAVGTMSGQNRQYFEESLPDGIYPHAVLSFPLLFQEQVTAMLTVSSFQKGTSFGVEAVQLLEEITPYLALMSTHFLLDKQEKAARAELDVTHKALRKEHIQLQRTTDLYNNLASLISQNRNIDDIMHAIYTSTQTPIAFYDELLFPISSFGTNEKNQLPDNFLSTSEVQYAISLKRWRLIKGKSDSLLVIPVTGAETVIGFLCAWIHEPTFNDGNRLLLEYSASMLGLELMKKRSIEETHRQAAGDVFEQLISGNYSDSVVRQARNLRLNESDYYTILICEGQQTADSFNQYFVKDSWIKWIQQTMNIAKIDGLVTQRGLDIIAFLTVSGQEEKHHVRQQMKKFAERLEKIPFDVKIGIGRVHKGFIQVRKSFIDAQQCLEMLHKKKSGKVLRFSDSGIYRLLLDQDKEELDLFVHDHIGPLLEHQSRKDRELLQTLLTYVTFDRDLSKTTKRLSIHHNTLYYRIKQIENILHVSFSDHDEWFDVSLACKIYLFLYE